MSFASREMKIRGKGLKDILNGCYDWKLAFYLAWADIRQRYRRSSLGPFWITISTGVMIGCLGFIFGTLFKIPSYEFLPFLAIGLITWGYIQTVLVEATTVFASAEAIIKQLPLPIFTHLLRMCFRNIYIFLHNIVIYPLVLLCIGRPLGWAGMLVIPGFLLLTFNLLWMSLILGIICSRFRDLSQIVINLLQVSFYVTPIIWLPSALPQKTSLMILEPNPFYHLIEIVRAPLMNQEPTALNWTFALVLCVIGWAIAIKMFNLYKPRIAYWL